MDLDLVLVCVFHSSHTTALSLCSLLVSVCFSLDTHRLVKRTDLHRSKLLSKGGWTGFCQGRRRRHCPVRVIWILGPSLACLQRGGVTLLFVRTTRASLTRFCFSRWLTCLLLLLCHRIMPDTSPRGDGVPNDDKYDLGQGAYVSFALPSYICWGDCTHRLFLPSHHHPPPPPP